MVEAPDPLRTGTQTPRLPMTMARAIPDDAACYFCLGEEGDEEGNSLVRDCSCRGNSGFAHLPCLIEYSKQKCRAAGDGDLPSFCEPWRKCNNCKQLFHNQLAIDLASACLSFAEATYGHPDSSKWDKMKVTAALRLKISAIFDATNDNHNETLQPVIPLINNLLSMVNRTKKDLNMSRWIHMPRHSEEYQYYKMMCGTYEAFAYTQLGRMLSGETKIIHYKKARAIYNLVGMKDDVQQMDTLISVLTAEKQAVNKQAAYDSDAITNSELEAIKKMYELTLRTRGMYSEVAIKIGLTYAEGLRGDNHSIGAERLVTKLATISRRVHGPDHKITIKAVELLDIFKLRGVIVLPDCKQFQALRYENDGEICIVTGPITKPRQIEEERIYHIENNLLIPNLGCPVICHGLVSASHLNGELGEVRHLKQDEKRCAVYFAKKGMKSALVKPANLRIAFELPSK